MITQNDAIEGRVQILGGRGQVKICDVQTNRTGQLYCAGQSRAEQKKVPVVAVGELQVLCDDSGRQSILYSQYSKSTEDSNVCVWNRRDCAVTSGAPVLRL